MSRNTMAGGASLGSACLHWRVGVGGRQQPPLALMLCESSSCCQVENIQKMNQELLIMFGNIQVSFIQFPQSRSGLCRESGNKSKGATAGLSND